MMFYFVLPIMVGYIIAFLVLYTVIMGYIYQLLQNTFSHWSFVNNSPFLSSFIGGFLYLVVKIALLFVWIDIPSILYFLILSLSLSVGNILLSFRSPEDSKKKWLIPLCFPSVVMPIISLQLRQAIVMSA